jgi:hypothetical protein
MKSAEQMHQTLLDCIAKLYREPEQYAWTLCGLDCLLHQLHWLIADATDRREEFAKLRTEMFVTDPTGWSRVHQSDTLHAVIEERPFFQPIIDEWREFDGRFGIRFDLES